MNSLIRTGTTIEKYSKNNEFNLFITIRYKKSVSDNPETLKQLTDKIFKTMQRRIRKDKRKKGIEKEEFRLLMIYELNNDLKYYHVHVMLYYPYKIKSLEKTTDKLKRAITAYSNGAVAVKPNGKADINIKPIINQWGLTQYLCKTFNEKIYRHFQRKRRKYDGIPYSAYVAALKGNKHRYTQINCKTPPTSKLYHNDK